ncbi:hypothetical protein U1707_15865 [Sphingomonas sp. PB2P12]|uniref:hypothetical protein n=1 Tax=Sphingomonas sandaracina TaxID=3096157 RepID=UPI002FC6386A
MTIASKIARVEPLDSDVQGCVRETAYLSGDDGMAKHVHLMIVFGILTGTLGAPLIANAQTPLQFDCDAPFDQFSTEAQIVAPPVTVVGTISALALVSKDYVPSASGVIVSADGRTVWDFR